MITSYREKWGTWEMHKKAGIPIEDEGLTHIH